MWLQGIWGESIILLSSLYPYCYDYYACSSFEGLGCLGCIGLEETYCVKHVQFHDHVRWLTLSIKIAQKPYIIGSLGPKVLKYESLDAKGKRCDSG